MATSKLIVKSTKKGSLATIYIRFRHGRDIDITVPTEFKVYPEYWNNVSQTFKQRVIFTNHFTEKEKNELVADFKDINQHILSAYNRSVIKDEKITKEWLTGAIYEYHHNLAPGDVKDPVFMNYINRFISECESGERIYDHNNRRETYKPLTIKNFKGFQTQFKEFQEKKNKLFKFDDITIDFYDEFVMFFIKKNYSPNTIGRNIKNLKTIMRLARDEGYHNNFEIERKKFKTIKVEVQNIYLTEKELQALYELNLADNPPYEVARDVFLIGCYTAQRFSDYSKINKDQIRKLKNGARVIDLIQRKTGERVMIPIRPELKMLLKKYDYTVPKIYEQKLNERIKKVALKAEIIENIIIEEVRGGRKISKKLPKNELIKTHTARRSGCTNMYLNGIPSIDIMKISGHKTEKEFLGYIKISKEETAQSLAMHPYFQGNSTLKVVN